MASARDLHDQPPGFAHPSRIGRRARVLSFVAAIAILAPWSATRGPTNEVSRADAEFEPSKVAVEMPELQDGKGNASRSSRSDPRKGAQHGVGTAGMAPLIAEKVRLEAERDGAAELRFPRGFAASDHSAAATAARERRLFEMRRAAVHRQKTLREQRITQMRHEVDGLLVQQRAREKEAQLFREELHLIDDMHGRKLANVARLMTLRRDLARSEGEVGGIVAQIARARGQIAEIELQTVEAEHKAVLEAYKEIRDVESRIDELSKRPLPGRDRPLRVELGQEDARALARNRSERRSNGGS